MEYYRIPGRLHSKTNRTIPSSQLCEQLYAWDAGARQGWWVHAVSLEKIGEVESIRTSPASWHDPVRVHPYPEALLAPEGL